MAGNSQRFQIFSQKIGSIIAATRVTGLVFIVIWRAVEREENLFWKRLDVFFVQLKQVDREGGFIRTTFGKGSASLSL